jgi:hypothetical protein
VLEGNGFFPARYELFVQYVEHFEKRHIGIYVREFVIDEFAFESAALPPDFECEFHLYC